MDYSNFILEAKQAPGFGKPARPKNKKKPSKEQLARWFSRSDAWREDYLKKFPRSMFKDVKATGKGKEKDTSVLSRSRKLSKSSTAMALVSGASEALKQWGMKGGKATREKAKVMHRSVQDFLKKDRSDTIEHAKGLFDKYRAKLSRKDREDIDEEAQKIANRPGTKASKILAGTKAKLPALIGVAIKLAMLGAIAGGVVPPDVVAYLGVKALDGAIEAFRGTLDQGSGGIATFIAGQAITNYLRSKDSDEYAGQISEKLDKRYKLKDDEEENDVKEKDNQAAPVADKKEEDTTKVENTETVKPSPEEDKDLKKLGIKLDPALYEQDENGNWVRKKRGT